VGQASRDLEGDGAIADRSLRAAAERAAKSVVEDPARSPAAAPRIRFGGIFVESERLVDDTAPVELVSNDLRPAGGLGLGVGWVVEAPCQGAAGRRGVTGREEAACLSISHEFARPAQIRRHHRPTAREGLDEDQREELRS